jgi:lipoprotein-anchoring transpeptidase ErfK/SrfK
VRAAGAVTGAGALVAAWALAGCGGAGSVTQSRPAASPGHRAPVHKVAGAFIVPRGRGHLTAWVRRPVLLHAAPGGRVLARLSAKTTFATPRVMPVIRRHGRWLGVIAAEAGNNRLGWVAAGGVSLYRVPFSIQVSLSRRTVSVRRDGIVVQRFTVGVGTPATPTPLGRFAVTDKLLTRAPGGPYGCCILALSGHQPNLREGWQGGDRIAIHGTDAPASIGQAASNGCLRSPAAAISRAVRLVPIGTIVRIRQ